MYNNNKKGLRLLVLLAGLSLAMTGWAVWKEQPVFKIDKLGLLAPELAAQIGNVTRLEITHGRGMAGSQTLTIDRRESGWVLSERADYPANQKLVNETLSALAGLELVAARTSSSQWHSSLGLTAPEDLGQAIRFRMLDADGTELTSIFLGKDEKSELDAVQSVRAIGEQQKNFYVRLESEDKTWLARGRIPRGKETAIWMDANLSLPSTDQIIAVDFSDIGEGSFNIDDAKGWNDIGFQTWLTAFPTLRADDVVSAENIDFASAKRIEVKLQSGDIFWLDVVSTSSNFWARLGSSAGEAGETGEVSETSWAYKFDGASKDILMPDF